MEKILMLGKIECTRRSRQQRMTWLDGITASTDMSLSSLLELVIAGKTCVLPSKGHKELDTTKCLN